MQEFEFPQARLWSAMGQIDITPPVGIYHRMWGAAAHDRSEGVHRPLLATMMMMVPIDSNRSQAVVVVSLDHCILDSEDVRLMQDSIAGNASIAPNQVMICLTHTHAAGLMSRSRSDSPGGDLIGPYLDQLARDLGKLANQVSSELQRSTLMFVQGRCDLAADRDAWDEQRNQFVCGFHPNADADDTMLLGRLSDDRGECIGTVVNYACHPTTLAWDNRLISPDYPGAMRELIQKETKAPCLFLQGASGDLGPKEGFVGQCEVADRHGRKLGFAALSALEGLPEAGCTLKYQGPVVSGTLIGTWKLEPLRPERAQANTVLVTKALEVQLPYRHDLATIEGTRQALAEHRQAENEARLLGDDLAAARHRALAEQMQRQIWRLESLPSGKCFPLQLSLVKTGQGLWLFLPGEHYSFFQQALRSKFPESPILIATICNGWQPGYIPPASKYGYGIYQETISLVAAGSAEVLLESITRTLKGMHGERHSQ